MKTQTTKRKLSISIYDKVNNLSKLYKYLGTKKEDVLLFITPSSRYEKYINACALIPKIAATYNEDKILDWTNTNQPKYLPYKYFGSGQWVVGFLVWCGSLYCPSGFYFHSEKAAREAYSNFTSVFEDFWEINNP